MPPLTVITGEVRFEPDASPFSDATVRVNLEDVSVADAGSRVIAQMVLPNISRRAPAMTPIRFTLRPPTALSQTRTYVVRAHVDLNGNNAIDEGDFITMQRFPVHVGPGPVHVAVTVRRVGGG